MITTRMMELRKRRGLMIALIVVTVGIPFVFLLIRLLLHAFAPHSYGPAGGYDVFTALVALVLYVFGFIVAATLGATAGSIDLTEGMFRHLVVTGRSRLALYLARIPAGLAIIWAFVAIGFTIVCVVCVFAAPTKVSYDGATIPAGLSHAGLETWAGEHVDTVAVRLPLSRVRPPSNVPCNNGPGGGPGGVIIKGPPGTVVPVAPSPAMLRAEASRSRGRTMPTTTGSSCTRPTPSWSRPGCGSSSKRLSGSSWDSACRRSSGSEPLPSSS